MKGHYAHAEDWMDELGLYILYFCTGKANQDSQGPHVLMLDVL
jgi:hypothetical protein